jgi:DNA-binding NarL/FixJ family response regulator
MWRPAPRARALRTAPHALAADETDTEWRPLADDIGACVADTSGMDQIPASYLDNTDTPSPLRIQVSHPEPLLALGLVAALRQHAGFEVSMACTHAGSSDEAWPDVVVTDYRGGVALAREGARRAQRRSAIMVMTMYNREHDVKAAMEAGVHGYVLQGCSVEELVTGVGVLASGGRYFCLEVAQRIADSLTREPLTPRETDVLRLLALGQCNKSISRQLEITVGTVKGHLRAIFNKLQAASRTEAVGIATRRGLIGEPMRTHPVRVHSRPADQAPSAAAGRSVAAASSSRTIDSTSSCADANSICRPVTRFSMRPARAMDVASARSFST